MRILGISAFYHDSAAVLLEDGHIAAAVQEERLTRIKHDPAFPTQAIRHCLERCPGEIDAVVYYEKPIVKFERILTTAFAVAPRGFGAFAAAIPAWVRRKLWVPAAIEGELQRLGHDVSARIHFATHHGSHAASAFFASPFPSAAIVTTDGVGEWTTTALAHGRGNRIEPLRELRFPHSLGLLYSAFTYYCGFRVNSGEYKLMGLAPYGQPRYRDLILGNLIDLKEDGSFRLNLDFFGYLRGETMVNERFCRLFGGPARSPSAETSQRDCDLARSIQVVAEEVILRLARTAFACTGEKRLCLAGGVALNCVANGRLLREGPFEEIWVQPAAGDAGGALGAALSYYYECKNAERRADGKTDLMLGTRLGPDYSDAAIDDALKDYGLSAPLLGDGEMLERVAARVAEGAVVGFFQGRAEFGPRALGSRSILADARSPEMQRVLNLKIKGRESFRPFAPIVLEERTGEYFDLAHPSPYMLFTAPVKESRRRSPADTSGDLLAQVNAVRSDIPAVTHVDYSARVQTVAREQMPQLHALLAAFERLTGCAVMINTSFNVRGEPPVCAPRDAIECFLRTEMDVLAIGNRVLEKRDVPSERIQQLPPRVFAPD